MNKNRELAFSMNSSLFRKTMENLYEVSWGDRIEQFAS